ncbi:hypothetical protein CLV59_105219 [Chitinophaga dinghuensis]|uniref:Uncharacterized protein n=1 Tax=Chitinophaga dinghuensis TaxID=1539050 RepID=A0A327VX98_9BACT|nr:hypothetical protein [Chitinophaga dinghuensis]RAJ80112.1 hypothetical protein CLV59_105219 [Chitinophaga dinghuensis]
MNQHEQLVVLLEAFKRKPIEEQHRLAWNMFFSFFKIFPLETTQKMINDLCAVSQSEAIFCFTESSKIKLLTFCGYLNKSLELLDYEVKKWEKDKDLPQFEDEEE